MRASKSVYHPNGDANTFKTVEETLDALKPYSGFLPYIVNLTDPNADRVLFWDDSAGSGAWLAFSGLTITGTTLAVDTATTSAAGVLTLATAAEYQAKTTGAKSLTPEKVWDGAAYTALTDGASISVDMSLGWNFSVTIGGNRTLSNPTNAKPGQSGCFKITASGATRTIDRGANYLTTSVSFPVSIASGNICYIFYFVDTSSRIIVTAAINNPT